MTIAVDARLFRTDSIHDYFAKELFFRLAKVQETHQFILFFDKPDNAATPANITTVIINPPPTNSFLYKWWYDFKISRAFKKHNVNIFIGTNGIDSFTTNIPQILIIQDPGFHRYSVFNCKLAYTKPSAKSLKKAAAIITFSDFTKKEMVNRFKISAKKIASVSYAAATYFKPLNLPEKEQVKEQYAQGCEYFIFSGGQGLAKNFIDLLKAFSIFKKWQKTNMKLLITINEKQYKEEQEKLKTYKYKNEVNFVQNLSDNDFAKVTAAAYAAIFPSVYEDSGLAVLEVLQCEVPVIVPANSSMSEIAGEAALYAEATKPEEIAEQMKRIFKDEALRSKLAAAGKERAKLYTFDKTIALLWQEIEKAVCS